MLAIDPETSYFPVLAVCIDLCGLQFFFGVKKQVILLASVPDGEENRKDNIVALE